jgi:hypothetical protein
MFFTIKNDNIRCLLLIGLATAGERPAERVSPPPEVNPNAVLWRTPDPPKDPQAGDVWVNPKDGMEMVYIASGEFILGTSDADIEAWQKGGNTLLGTVIMFVPLAVAAGMTPTKGNFDFEFICFSASAIAPGKRLATAWMPKFEYGCELK